MAGIVGTSAPSGATAPPATTDAVTLTDDTGTLTLDVPSAWTEVNTAQVTYEDGTVHSQISAAPNLDDLFNTYATPGVIYTQWDYAPDTAVGLPAIYDFSRACTDGGITPYSDSYFSGSMQTWTNCDASESRIVTVLASSYDRAFSVSVLVQLPTPADDPSLDVVLDSFYVVAPTSVRVDDDSSQILMWVPVAWTDIVTVPVATTPTGTTPAIVASTSITAATNTPMAAFFTEAYTTELAAVLDPTLVPGCTPGTAAPYDDGYFVGLRLDFTGCSNGLRATMVAANAAGRTDLTALVVVVTQPGDDTSVNIVLNSFSFAQVDGVSAPTTVPGPGVTVDVASPGASSPATTVAVTAAVTAPVTAIPATATSVSAAAVTTTPSVTAPLVSAPSVVKPTVTTTIPGTTVSSVASQGPIATTALVDDTGVLTLSIPSAWTATDTSPSTSRDGSANVLFPSITASPTSDAADPNDIAVYYTLFQTTDDLNNLLAQNAPNCTPGRIVAFDNGHLSGLRQDFTNCEGGVRDVFVAANLPGDRGTAALALYSAPADDAVVETVLASMAATDVLPSYQLIDATNLITVRVPTWWSVWNVDLSTDGDSGVQVPNIYAATPGEGTELNELYFSAFSYVDPQQLLDANDRSSECTDGGVVPYDDGAFVGLQRTWTNCDGDADSQLIQVFAAPADKSFVAAVSIWMFIPQDGVVDLILGSFDIAPEPDPTTTTTSAAPAVDPTAVTTTVTTTS